MTTIKVERYIYVGHGHVNVPLKRRRWLELIFSLLLLTTMTVVLVQLILFCDFSDFGIALGINYSLFTLPLKLVILLSKIYYWSKGDGKKELKREKTGMY